MSSLQAIRNMQDEIARLATQISITFGTEQPEANQAVSSLMQAKQHLSMLISDLDM